MRPSFSSTFQGVMAVLACSLAGCGDGGSTYEGDARAAVSGRVTMNGSPVVNGTIRFVPVESGRRSAGTVIVDGKYSITEGQGPNFGDFTVVISAPEEEEGSDDPDNPKLRETVPAKYNTATELKVSISKKKTTEDFNLTSE